MNDQGVLITDHRVQRKESPEQCLGGVCVCMQCQRACAVLESQPADTDMGGGEKKK